jgi:hypothetical protein
VYLQLLKPSKDMVSFLCSLLTVPDALIVELKDFYFHFYNVLGELCTQAAGTYIPTVLRCAHLMLIERKQV